MTQLSRRAFSALTLCGVALPGLAHAALGDVAEYGPQDHLQATIRAPDASFLPDPRQPGIRSLGLDKRKDAILFTPGGMDFSKPVPLVVSLHGKGGVAYDGLEIFKSAAAQHKFLVLAVPSRAETWNVPLGPTGPDAAFIDRALDWVFSRFPIDPRHLAMAGHSDGASYALCMGLQNGDLFSDVLVFAAIRFSAPDARGKPRFFFSHGRMDEGAPFKGALEMVQQLKDLGYDVALDVHPKGHMVEAQGVKAAVARFLSAPA